MSRGSGRRVVIGVGNEYRRDDGFGLSVAARLAELRRSDPWLSAVDVLACDGEPTRLINLWAGADLAVVVDAARDSVGPAGPAGPAGHRHELALDELDALGESRFASSHSSHGLGLGSTVELGRVLGRLPRRLVVLAVSGSEFGFGTGLTPAVAAAVAPAVKRVRDLVSGQCR
jgi:hydrogenase maturation protease